MDFDRALESVVIGLALMVAQNVIATHPWFGEEQIRDYLRARRAYHEQFAQAATALADEIEDVPKLAPAAGPLRRLSMLTPKQDQQALVLAARAFQSLGRIRINDLEDTRLMRVLIPLNRIIDLFVAEERGEYWQGGRALAALVEALLPMKALPAKLKTLFRQLLKLRGLDLDYMVPTANPGAWFDMPSEERVVIRQRADDLEAARNAIFHEIEDPTERQREYQRVAAELSALQAEAGVNLTIITRADQEPLQDVLRREKRLNRDGPTEYVLDQMKRSFQESFDEFPEQRGYMTKRELGKLMTLLDRAKTFDTMERIIREAVDRKLLHDYDIEGFLTRISQARRNKALRDGTPLVPLQFEPVEPDDFRAKHNTGEIVFQGDWSEDEQREVLGRVSTAIGTLEGIFGKGFCGKHAKKLEMRFEGGAGVGAFAKASYFGWENRNRWQPRVTFGKDFEGLLAHELSHYYEDLLAYQIEDALEGVPAYQYGDVGHGPGDIFGLTGTTATWFVERAESAPPDSRQGRVVAAFPELLELFQAIVKTEDYARWEDRVGVALEMTLPNALKDHGIDPWSDEGEKLLQVKYKSELPPEIVADAEKRYERMMDGDKRKLTYYQSSPEVWARMMEQYVYTKLSRAGIANPWLTQLTYDIDVMDQFMADDTFETQLEPIFDRLFQRLRTRGMIARLVRRFMGA